MKCKPYISEIMDEIFQGIFEILNKEKMKQRKRNDDEIGKWYNYSQLMFKWMRVRENKHSIVEYLKKYKCEKVAVYGIGDIGKLCCDELLEWGVYIPYIIDRNIRGNYKDIPIVLPKKVDNQIDVVVITPICYYLEIANTLYKRTNAKLISLEDIISVLSEVEKGEKYESC